MTTARQILERQLTPHQRTVFHQTLMELKNHELQNQLAKLASEIHEDYGSEAFLQQTSENEGIFLGIAFLTANLSVKAL